MEIGIDIVQNKRLSNELLIKRFLSKKEYDIYLNLNDNNLKLQYASGRWSAKEAIVKASNRKIFFSNIEILNDKNGRPIVFVEGLERRNIKISISHEKDYSVSFCLIQ